MVIYLYSEADDLLLTSLLPVSDENPETPELILPKCIHVLQLIRQYCIHTCIALMIYWVLIYWCLKMCWISFVWTKLECAILDKCKRGGYSSFYPPIASIVVRKLLIVLCITNVRRDWVRCILKHDMIFDMIWYLFWTKWYIEVVGATHAG